MSLTVHVIGYRNIGIIRQQKTSKNCWESSLNFNVSIFSVWPWSSMWLVSFQRLCLEQCEVSSLTWTMHIFFSPNIHWILLRKFISKGQTIKVELCCDSLRGLSGNIKRNKYRNNLCSSSMYYLPHDLKLDSPPFSLVHLPL